MKKAFTMLELVFVIVIIGILALVIVPNTRSNPVNEAALQLISHIRYTQHLAMVNDTYNASDPQWYKSRWQLVFTFNNNFADNKPSYTIFLDGGAYGGNPTFGEIARNPENINQLMTGGYGANKLDIKDNDFAGMKKMNLGLTYGITSVSYTSPSCSNTSPTATYPSLRLSFDHLGRPIKGKNSSMSSPYNISIPFNPAKQRLITSDCHITITNGSETAIIKIVPETGFTCILDATGNNCI